jgi:CHAD domain-containing protein
MNARPPSTTSAVHTTLSTPSLPDFRILLLDALHDRWRTFRAELKRCQEKYSEEAVHDLRVATRRLISTLDLVVSIHPKANLRRARRALKRQLDRFGPLRDAQVELLAVDKMLATFPELRGFYTFLRRRERRLVQRLGAEIKKVKTGKVKRAIRSAIKEIDVLLAAPESRQEKHAEALSAVEASFNRVVERKQAVDAADSATIHRMRVAFKKFRYMVESLAPILGRGTSKRLKAMNAFQGDMGDIQDAEVLLASLMAFAHKHGPESAAALSRALEELRRHRTALIEAFLGSAERLYAFWKPMA